ARYRLFLNMLLVVNWIFFGSSHLCADDFSGRTVDRVNVVADGFTRVNGQEVFEDLILLKAGAPYTPAQVRASIYRLVSTGMIADTRVEAEEAPGQKVVVTFRIERKLRVKEVSLTRDLKLRTRRLQEALFVRAGDYFTPDALSRTEAQIRLAYQRRGFRQVAVKPELRIDRAAAEVHIRFRVQPGPRAQLADLQITGNADPLSPTERKR